MQQSPDHADGQTGTAVSAMNVIRLAQYSPSKRLLFRSKFNGLCRGGVPGCSRRWHRNNLARIRRKN